VEGWFLLGPVAVHARFQRRGIGSALVAAGLKAIRALGADGGALVGDPGSYGRFGFRARPGLTCEGVSREYNEDVLCLPLRGAVPVGCIRAHEAFAV
jgi:putative acetyltransferase